MMKINLLKLAFLCTLLCNSLLSCQAQEPPKPIPLTVPNQLDNSYNLLSDSLPNQIYDATALDAFFKKIALLKETKKGVVNIVHIGDSHLQADMMTAVVRRDLQKHFGNAGRGAFFPYRVAKTNAPYDQGSSSNVGWESKRCVFPDKSSLPIGLMGITMKTTSLSAEISLYCKNYDNLQYKFDKITLFQKKSKSSFDWRITDENHPENDLTVYSEPFFDGDCSNTIYLPKATSKVTFKATPQAGQNASIWQGVVLENTQEAGILYHTIGVNGAQAKHYNIADDFYDQLRQLNADLVIVSLGTNESYAPAFDETTYAQQLQEMVNKLRAANPYAVIMINTPADCYYSKRYNTRLQKIATQQVAFAREEGLPCWDLYGLAGGHKSAAKWKNSGLMSKDGVHFGGRGYKHQGHLFLNALYTAYNQYVSRH